MLPFQEGRINLIRASATAGYAKTASLASIPDLCPSTTEYRAYLARKQHLLEAQSNMTPPQGKEDELFAHATCAG